LKRPWSTARPAAFSVALALFFCGACATIRSVLRPFGAPKKVATATTRIPEARELPGVVGRVQHVDVRSGETLLDIARANGLGYQQLQDANPSVDEWVPAPDTELVVPSRWILPRSHYRGVVINIPEMRLYLFPDSTRPGSKVEVHTWPIGIGTDDTPSPVGPFHIRTKEENPTWVVPDSILKTMDPPRRVVPPGPDNPLGQYRLRLSYGLYAIHGTDSPWAIGRLTTHGCIRLYPEDIPRLFELVRIGTPGELLYQPVKIGEEDGEIYLEVHPDLYKRIPSLERQALEEVRRAGVAERVDWKLVRDAVREKSGIPVNVSKRRLDLTSAARP